MRLESSGRLDSFDARDDPSPARGSEPLDDAARAGGAMALAIAGPTASGKSAAAMAVAERWPAEIVSVDSAQVYRGMDIGTAKPTPAERERVPHHLIDLLDPRDAYSAARFAAEAEALIEAIRARGRLPLLVGGTMLYFKALADGLDPMPPADAAIRAGIDAHAAREGWPALHAELVRLDAESAARIGAHDAQRIQRALEICLASDRPASSFRTRADTQRAPRSAPRFEMLSLEPSRRDWLHGRIEARFGAMLEAGFVGEVRRLRSRGDLHPALPAMRAVGYRQAWAALDAGDLAPLKERAVAATRQLAKRQLTWLRSMPARTVVACDDANAAGAIVDRVAERIATLLPATSSKPRTG